MIENIFELLQFLAFLLQLIYFSLIGIYSFISFLDDLCLLFDLSFELLVGDLQASDLILIFSLLLHILLFFLLFLWYFFLDDWNFTFCPQRSLGEFLHFFRVLALDFIHFLFFLLGDLLHSLDMFFLKSVNLLYYILFSLFLVFYLLLVILL